MGLWFVLCVVVFAGTGAWALFTAGLPLSLQTGLQPVYATSVLMILTAAGLMRRLNAARALGIAFSIWILLSAIMISVPVRIPAEVAAFNIFRVLPFGPWLANPLLAALIGGLFALRSLRMFYSPLMSDAFLRYPPAIWKTAIAFVVVGAALVTDLALPAQQRKSLPVAAAAGANSQAVGGARGNAPQMPTDTAGIVAGAHVVACKFSLDETFLMLVTSDGQGHRVDLRTGKFVSYPSKIDVREWPASFTKAGADPIGSDADMYFDSDRNIVAKFSDPKFAYSIGSHRFFVSFTSTPSQIITFKREKSVLQRLELPIGSEIWSVYMSDLGKSPKPVGYISPDYAWLTVGTDVSTWIVHAREGRTRDIVGPPKDMKPPQFGGRWMRLSGLNKHTIVTLPEGGRNGFELPTEDLILIDVEKQLYLTQAGSLKLQAGSTSLGAGVFAASMLNPPTSLVFAQNESKQLNLVDLETRETRGVGRIYDKPFDQSHSCFTVSSTRRVFAATNGNQAEIFWSAFVAAGNFRSVQLTLPVKN